MIDNNIIIMKPNQEDWSKTVLPGSSNRGYWNLDDKEIFITKLRKDSHIPIHDHPGREFTYLLKGEMVVNNQKLSAGDFLTAGPGDYHQINVTEEVICFIITEKSIKFLKQ